MFGFEFKVRELLLALVDLEKSIYQCELRNSFLQATTPVLNRPRTTLNEMAEVQKRGIDYLERYNYCAVKLLDLVKEETGKYPDRDWIKNFAEANNFEFYPDPDWLNYLNLLLGEIGSEKQEGNSMPTEETVK